MRFTLVVQSLPSLQYILYYSHTFVMSFILFSPSFRLFPSACLVLFVLFLESYCLFLTLHERDHFLFPPIQRYTFYFTHMCPHLPMYSSTPYTQKHSK